MNGDGSVCWLDGPPHPHISTHTINLEHSGWNEKGFHESQNKKGASHLIQEPIRYNVYASFLFHVIPGSCDVNKWTQLELDACICNERGLSCNGSWETPPSHNSPPSAPSAPPFHSPSTSTHCIQFISFSFLHELF